MGFFEAKDEKKSMVSQGYTRAVHLEVIRRWNNTRYNIVLKDAQQVKNFRDAHKDWDVEINEIR